MFYPKDIKCCAKAIRIHIKKLHLNHRQPEECQRNIHTDNPKHMQVPTYIIPRKYMRKKNFSGSSLQQEIHDIWGTLMCAWSSFDIWCARFHFVWNMYLEKSVGHHTGVWFWTWFTQTCANNAIVSLFYSSCGMKFIHCYYRRCIFGVCLGLSIKLWSIKIKLKFPFNWVYRNPCLLISFPTIFCLPLINTFLLLSLANSINKNIATSATVLIAFFDQQKIILNVIWR